jgi:glycosyltransferase involved in cell wall biosynthesis
LNRKIKVLVFNQYYIPGYKSGGPIQTIVNLVHALSDKFDFYIFTSDRDALDKEPYPGIKVNTWCCVEKAYVFYAAPHMKNFTGIRHIINETPHDILYLNSFFNFHFTIVPLILRRLSLIPEKPLIIAPRGEFAQGALSVKKIKKQIFIFFSKIINLYYDVLWQASSDFEKNDIFIALGKRERVSVATDLPQRIMSAHESKQDLHDCKYKLKILFLSRISQVKNLEFAFLVLNKVKCDLLFNIYGPIREPKYWSKCQVLFKKLPDNIRVSYCGSVEHHQVCSIMAKHDLFFLPTLGENYGHVIAESLSVGTPALIANTTPWRNLEADHMGWDLPLSSPSLFADKISFCAEMNTEERSIWRQNIRNIAKSKFFNLKDIEANRQLFFDALKTKNLTSI